MPDNKKFLDYDGLIFLWGKIRDALNTKLNTTDIAAWAKAANKPDYDSSEISHEFDSDVSLTPDVETVEEALNYLYTFSEDVHNKVPSSTGISASSTDGQYPSAKATYNAVNAKADKATTLAGYGITNAYTKTETDTAINNKIQVLTASYNIATDQWVTAPSLPGNPSVYYEVALTVTDGTNSKLYTIPHAGTLPTDNFVGFIEWDAIIYKVIIHPDPGQAGTTITLTETKGGEIEIFHATYDGSDITVVEPISVTILDALNKPAMMDLTVDHTGYAGGDQDIHVLLMLNGSDTIGESPEYYYFEGIINFDLNDIDNTMAHGYTYIVSVSVSNYSVILDSCIKLLHDSDISAWAKASTKPSYSASEISYGSSSNVNTALNNKADAATTLAGYGITNAYTKTETDSAIASAVGEITGIDFQIVQTLPASGVKGTIYLVSNSGTGQNVYDEYIWLAPEGGTAHWEKIGTTDIDLTNYWNTTNLSAMSNTDIQNAINAAETPAS